MIYLCETIWKLCFIVPKKSLSLNPINPYRPDPGRREKINLNFYFTIACGDTKGFVKAFKAFKKPFETPQRNVKIKN